MIRTYLEIAAVAIILGAFGWYTIHERQIGEHTIEAADAKAERAAKALVDAQTKHAQDLSNQAEQAAIHEQKIVDNYALTHPVGPVRLCVAPAGGPGVPKASAPSAGTKGAGPGPTALSAVPPIAVGADIGPGLTIIVQAAGRLATLDAERQQR